MNKPASILHAEIAIWLTIGISALVAVINRNLGLISPGMFMWYLIGYGLYCIFPYKIGRGSNAARYTYTVFTVISLLMMLASGMTVGMTKLDIYSSYTMLPITAFILFNLFKSESSVWLTSRDEKK